VGHGVSVEKLAWPTTWRESLISRALLWVPPRVPMRVIDVSARAFPASRHRATIETAARLVEFT
jgi:hypothetical protein